MAKRFSHLDPAGRARMVDVSGKPETKRLARAEAKVWVSLAVVEAVTALALPKGNPFEVARMAGILAAKRTSDLIPLCHPLQLDFVDVQIRLEADHFHVESEVICRRATGVEMEALAAVTLAALTLYDMCKAVDSAMRIGDIRLAEKRKLPLTLEGKAGREESSASGQRDEGSGA
jgi:cyclic pyranopterin phosphate synthase